RPDRPRGERRRDGEDGQSRPPRQGKPGGKPGGSPRGDRNENRGKGGKPERSFEARPPRDKPMDPDSPFAVLAALKNKT
ncbi:MAG TPA: hypothetical protein GX686_06820, partial [Paracoccus sp.]|nr:hypothetical protein [Paracoccus sp. (in: a-proteobacteria)]